MRLGLSQALIAFADALVKLEVIVVEAIPAAIVLSAPQSQLWGKVQKDRDIGGEAAGYKAGDNPQGFQVELMSVTLVSQ